MLYMFRKQQVLQSKLLYAAHKSKTATITHYLLYLLRNSLANAESFTMQIKPGVPPYTTYLKYVS